MIDAHAHLQADAFAPDLPDVLERAAGAGIRWILVPGWDVRSSRAAIELCRTHASGGLSLAAAAGIHPHAAREADAAAWSVVETLAVDPTVVAIGETGLDYHYDNSPREDQRRAFEAQLELAARSGKPAVVHAREADDDVAAILRNHPKAVAVLHSWSSGENLFRTGLELGHYFSFSGMVTFRGWRDDEAVRRVPPDRLLIETDAPYLAPVPHRGKRNEPAFVVEVARQIATVRDRSLEEIERQTTQNAVRVFGERLRGEK